MAKKVLFGAIAASAIAFTAHAAPSTPTRWEHNGSTVYLMADGANREFRYNQPRPGMLEAGAQPGSLLFTGRSGGGRYVGTAYIFHPDCDQFPYHVSGPILDNYERVVLKGLAPRVDANCNIQGYFADVLEFSLLKIGRTRSDPLEAYAYAKSDSYGAIAFSQGTRAHGYSYKYGTRRGAEERALQECGQDCSVVLWFKNACGALAAGEDDHGTGWAKSRGEAEDMALSNCNDRSTQCRIVRWVCTAR
jgi:uncharacterized protein DUF4189